VIINVSEKKVELIIGREIATNAAKQEAAPKDVKQLQTNLLYHINISN
jgi:hypothetical protein